MNQEIAGIRINYSKKSLLEADVAADPIIQFNRWWQEAIESQILEVNAMTLATADANGIPDARIVLLKGVSEKGFVFFTNYESRKGKELQANAHACLVFFWKELERQVRIMGPVARVSEAESDAYFYSRPAGSQIGAMASPQSTVIPNREFLDQQTKSITDSIAGGQDIVRPTHWGGYQVAPVSVEFWQGRPSRLHDRLRYTLQEDLLWKIERLAP
ncbi:pyridoxamine 5'-phosphate oxidase [Niabella hirudinis]|uniref:pyridoxamine 5'-phosphate oxidase n=1 Tax=Niabella hirudinis TaxID=1285929 RepID=UPI003EB89A86